MSLPMDIAAPRTIDDGTEPEDSSTLLDLIAEWEERRLGGEEAAPESLCGDRPDLVPTLRDMIARRRYLHGLLGLGEPQGAAATRLPSFPGHETLGEVGRGGMGIVYRARDEALGRIVAIKTIAHATHATPEQVGRFLAEARAAALVRHANVVPIHTIGESEGIPFFSMEFVDGGNLADRLRSGTLAPVAAAGLIGDIARAVHRIHEAGIVHRDLKPSNVLFTGEGVPKVGDFGLAKLIDAGAGFSVSGQVVGTPSYMAPEQAAPRRSPLGRAVDVHALGAILYHALAGKPPFLGETQADTLRLVGSAEVVPPRVLRPDIPRDLDTIAMKALAREPSSRYATAEDLADDLARFLAGEPIRARRSGPLERAWRRGRRHPLVTGLIGLSIAVFLAAFAAVAVAWRNADASRALAERRRLEAESSAREAVRQESRALAGEAEARAAVDEYLNRVTDSEALQAPGLQSLRRALLESGLGFYRRLLDHRAGGPDLRLVEAEVQSRVARITAELAPGPDAVAAWSRAESLYRELRRERPGDDSVTLGLADVWVARGRPRRAAAAMDDMVRRHPEDIPARRLLVRSLNDSAAAWSSEGNPAAALSCLLRAFDLGQDLARRGPGGAEDHEQLARALSWLAVEVSSPPALKGEISLALLGHAAAHADRSISLAPGRRHSLAVRLHIRRQVAGLYFHLGLIDEAMAEYRADVEFGRACIARNPEIPHVYWDLQQTLMMKANAEIERGMRPQAADTLAAAIGVLKEIEDRGFPDDGRAPRLHAERAKAQALIARVGGPPPGGPPADAGAAADQAVASLTTAFGRGLSDAGWLKTSPDLDALRGRDDFRRLLAAMEAPPPREPAGPEAAAAPPAVIPDERAERCDVDLAASVLATYRGVPEVYSERIERARVAQETLLREAPGEASHRLRMARIHQVVSEHEIRLHRLAESDRALRDCRRELDALLRDHPGDRTLAGFAGIGLWWLAISRGQAGLWSDARDLYRRAEAISNAEFWRSRSGDRAYVSLAIGDLAEYRRVTRLSLDWWRGKEAGLNLADVAKIASFVPGPDFDPAELVRIGELGASRVEPSGNSHWTAMFLGLEYYRAGRTADAARAIDRLMPESPMHDVGLNLRALIEHRLGRHQRAIAALDAARSVQRRAVHNALDQPPLRLPWGSWYPWVEFRQLNREARQAVEGRPPGEPWYPLFSARAEAARGRFAEAQSLLDEAGREAGDDADFLAARARVWAEMGREAPARRDLDRALTLAPASFDALCARGNASLAHGRTDAGVADLLRAADQRPVGELTSQDERARANRGLAASDAAYRRAIGARPADLSLRRARARHLAWHRRWAEAEAEIASANTPPEREDWFWLAFLSLAAGDRERYLECCRAMITRVAPAADDVARHEAARVLSLAANQVLDPALLAAWGRETTQAHADRPWCRNAWGYALYRAALYDQAAEAFLENSRRGYWSGRYVDQLGLCLVEARRGHIEESRVWLEQAEKRIEDIGRQADVHSLAYPLEVHEIEWAQANILLPEARDTLRRAEAERIAADAAEERPLPR